MMIIALKERHMVVVGCIIVPKYHHVLVPVNMLPYLAKRDFADVIKDVRMGTYRGLPGRPDITPKCL